MPHTFTSGNAKVCIRCQQLYVRTNSRQKYCGSWIKKTGCSYLELLEFGRRKYRKIKEKNPDLLRAKHQRYYQRHKELISLKAKAWRRNNPIKSREKARLARQRAGSAKLQVYVRHYDARKRNAPGTFSLEEWEALKKTYSFRCPMCWKFEPEIKLTIDHKIPLSRGGTNYIDNIQPLCFICNSRKRAETWFACYPINFMKIAYLSLQTTEENWPLV